MYEPKIFHLDNKLTVIIDHYPHVETACVGLFANIGSRVEHIKNNGITHFLEHMLFKGTTTRNFYQISEEIESRGGYINAWTSKDKTAWYSKVIKDDVLLATDILCDIFCNSTFPEVEFAKEKDVVIEEIKQSQDEPDDLLYNYSQQLCFPDSALGLSILGSKETICNLTINDLHHHLKYYNTDNTVFVAAGNINTDLLLNELNRVAFPSHPPMNDTENTVYVGGEGVLIKENLNQSHLVVIYPTVDIHSPDYYTYLLLSAILGKGMSSRLFKEVRENRGLAYSIWSSITAYHDVGTLTIHAGCSHSKVTEVIDLIRIEIQNLANNTVSENELLKAKHQLTGSLYQILENSYCRAERWAFSMLNFKSIISIKENTQKINQITQEDILRVAQVLHNQQPVIAVLSNQHIAI